MNQFNIRIVFSFDIKIEPTTILPKTSYLIFDSSTEPKVFITFQMCVDVFLFTINTEAGAIFGETIFICSSFDKFRGKNWQ